jgi:arylsulfatase
MDIGRDNGLPVDLGYADKLPFAFTGTVKRVIFDIPSLSGQSADAVQRAAARGRIARGIVG